MRNLKPKMDNVLIEVVVKDVVDDGMEKTKSGILLPGREQAKTTAGYSHSTHKFVVRAVGPQVVDLKEGDLVIFANNYASAIKDDDDRMLVLLKEEYVTAVYED